jgi:hypothetical protein
MRRLALLALAWTALAAQALAAPAAPPAPRPPPRLFLSPSGEPFRLSPATPDPLRAWFDQADANHDGVIDRAEFRADAARFFKVLDTNGDGVIDGFEASAYEAKIVPELGQAAEGRYPAEPDSAAGHGEKPHAAAGRRPKGPARRAIGQLIGEPEPVTGADYALDGRITLAEWMRATDQRFELLDAGATGRLTLEALKSRMDGAATQQRR